MRARSTLITGVTIASILAGAGLALSQAPSAPPGKPTSEPTTTGPGKKAPARQTTKTCTNGRKAPTVAYIFRGRATASDATSVSVDLLGANRHGTALLKAASPTVQISPTAATDLLTATIEAGKTKVTRKDTAGTVTATAATGIVAGDSVVLQYRGTFIPRGWTCTGVSAPSVAAATPGPGPLSLSGLTLKKVTAAAPTPPA